MSVSCCALTNLKGVWWCFVLLGFFFFLVEEMSKLVHSYKVVLDDRTNPLGI